MSVKFAKSEVVGIRIKKERTKELRVLAEKEKRPLSNFINLLMELGLERFRNKEKKP